MGDAVGLVIDGEVVAGEAGTYPVTNPVRPAEVVVDGPSASLAQLDRAVAAARRAAPAWAALSQAERAEMVGKAAAAAGAVVGASDLARLLTREHGKVLWEAEFDAGTMGGMAGAFAPLAAEALEARSLGGGGGRRTTVEYVPYGVVAAVLPFNWPVSVLGNKLLPALLTGNTVVVKAPPTCPGAVLAVAAALAEALPPGVVNALNGPGPELGQALVAHRDVDMVSFTGGVPTGRAVMAAASDGLTPVVLDSACFSVPKLFFAYGLGNALYFPFAVGGTAILWPGPPTPHHVFATIERHRPTLFFSVPTGYGRMLAEEGSFELSSIRLASSAGESLPAALYERFKARFGVDILDGIGSTEVLHTFIANRPGAIRPGSSGQVVPGYEARLIDDDGLPIAPGETGHLWIKGDSVCAEYWNQPGKTKDAIDGDWIRTGDKYSVDADGYYWYAGRSDDMLKVGGLWVSPAEVENTLIAHPAVLECGVIGHEDRDGLVKPMAFVVLRADERGTPDLAAALRQFVRERLAEYKRPRWVEFVGELPRTATGKLQRFRLREVARTRPASPDVR